MDGPCGRVVAWGVDELSLAVRASSNITIPLLLQVCADHRSDGRANQQTHTSCRGWKGDEARIARRAICL
jgi:hypothetical protein